LSRGNNRREQDLQSQLDTARTQLNSDRAAVREPSELEKRLDADSLKWLDATDPSKGPVDYTHLPGVNNFGAYEEGLANREDERTATGGMQFGAKGANPTAFALAKKQSSDRRAERAAMGFASDVKARDASVRGTALSLMAADNARDATLLNSSSGLYGQAAQNKANYQPPPSPWWGVAQAGMAAFL
jgi:hypothetical protein